MENYPKKSPLLVIFDENDRELLAGVESEIFGVTNRRNLQNLLTRRAVQLVYSDEKLRNRVIRELVSA